MGYLDKYEQDGTLYDLRDSGAVRADGAQILTDAQKMQARENIGGAGVQDSKSLRVQQHMIDYRGPYYHREKAPSSSTGAYHVGCTADGETITLDGENDTGNYIYIRLTGNGTQTASPSTVKGWNPVYSIPAGTRVRSVLRLVSGSYSGGKISVSFYKAGSSSTVGTGSFPAPGMHAREWESDGDPFNVVLLVQAGTVITNAVFTLTITDMDAVELENDAAASLMTNLANVTGVTVTYDTNTKYTAAISYDGNSTVASWAATKVKVRPGQIVLVEFYGQTDHNEDGYGGGLVVEFFKTEDNTSSIVGEGQNEDPHKYNMYVTSTTRMGYHRYGAIAPMGVDYARVRVFTKKKTSITLRSLKITVTDEHAQRQRTGILYDGHLGAVMSAPRNTLPSLELAKRAGFSTCIVNVRACSSGDLVCIHDATVDATSDGSGNVADKTLAELRQLDFGGWYDPIYAGTSVLTFEEAAQMLATAGIGIGTSIHANALSNDDIAALCAIYKKWGQGLPNFIKSFDMGVLTACYVILGDSVDYVYVKDSISTSDIDAAAAFQGHCTIEMKSTNISAAKVTYAQSLDVPVSMFFGNEILQVMPWIKAGVTRFTVDTFPDNVFPVE